MNKKEYVMPSMKVAELENANIICTSTTSYSLIDEEVEDYGKQQERPVSEDIWGKQW